MLSYTRTVQTIDAHTGGEPLRILVSGLPQIPGQNILEKRSWLQENRDDLRQFLMNEPRGHADMYGAYLLPPVTPKADFGVIFIHNEGYSDMCGHGIIALGKVLVEMGYVERTSPLTHIAFDAPAGFIEASVEWDGKHHRRRWTANKPATLPSRTCRLLFISATSKSIRQALARLPATSCSVALSITTSMPIKPA